MKTKVSALGQVADLVVTDSNLRHGCAELLYSHESEMSLSHKITYSTWHIKELNTQ